VATVTAVDNPGGVAKSVFALVVGLLLMVGSGAAYAYLVLIRTEGDAQTTTAPTTTPDTGVAACESVRALHESGGGIGDVDSAIVAGLTNSTNTNLRAAGEAFEMVAALPAEQRQAASAEVVAALTHLAAGCAAVGVPLPAELVNP
jgi:hypothetical protein